MKLTKQDKIILDVAKAIENPIRLKLLQMIIINTHLTDCSPGYFQKKLKISQPLCSIHLKHLKRLKIIYGKKNGRNITYRMENTYEAKLAITLLTIYLEKGK
jgi:hypothetical protein